jgi:phospholipid/cholesterol/gamma-HCH transport system substrate-binding protein
MRARIVSLIVTLAVIGGAVAAYSFTRPDTEMYMVTADIERGPNLFAGARVRVRGVEVGKVVSVDPEPDFVHLTMEIEEGIDVPAGARLAVIPVTVISDRYVQLFPAYKEGPTLADGDHIALGDTSIPAELDDVLNQLQGLLEALEPQQDEERGSLARLITSLDKVFRGRSAELAGTLEGSATVLENLADSHSDITRLIQNLDRLFVSLASRSSQIGIVNERFRLVTEALLGDQENLEGTIENITFLSDEVAGLIADSGDDLGESLGRLAHVLRVVLKHQDALSEGVKWGNVIAQATGAVDSSGRGLNAYSGRQFPPGTAESVYNYRLDSRDTITCERMQNVANSLFVVLPEAGVFEVKRTLLSFIPDPYDDDLDFLLAQLVPLCVEFPGESSLAPETQEEIRRLVDDIGIERFEELLGRWFLDGYRETQP